jgi:hypothetical protein
VRRYEAELEDARTKVRGLRREEEACVDRLNLEGRRLQDAEGRAGEARGRLVPAALGAGVGEPFSLAEQAGAQRDLDSADADARRAEAAIEREREELGRLRRAAARERERIADVEDTAAAAVRQAAGELPDVRLPTGETSPPALTGTPFDPSTRSDFDRRLAAAGRTEQVEEQRKEREGDFEDDVGGMLAGVTGFRFFGDSNTRRYQDTEKAATYSSGIGALRKGATAGIKKGIKEIAGEGGEQAAKRSPGDLARAGRRGKQQRLRELADDPNAPSWVRGWVRQDLNEIAEGQRKRIRVPPGYELAHRRGQEARRGFGYEFSDLKDILTHRRQHRIERLGQ